MSYWLKKYGLKASKAGSHAPKGTLSRSDLKELVQAGLTLREIADRLDRSTTTIRYWLRKYDLRLRRSRRSRVPEELRREVKRKLVEEAGGKCVVCGYSRSQQGLQFHHLDPKTKEFHLGRAGLTRSLAKSRAEAQKCVLLCANCHAEVEAGLIELPAKTELPLNSTGGATQSGVVHSD